MPTSTITDQYALRVRVLKALAHPTRLFLVEELACGPRCVCELTALVGDDVSTVSKHLALLREAGVVASERRGQEVHYRLRVPCVLEIFDCIEGVVGPAEGDGGATCRAGR